MRELIGKLFGMLLLTVAAFGQSDDGKRFAGAWDVVVTPRVCATGAPITTFQSSYNFDRGGTLSGLSSGTGSGGRGREQLGVWKHVSGNHYRFRIKAYPVNSAGGISIYQIVTHDAVLDDDSLSWSSTGDSRSYTLDGVQIAVGCSTITAVRVPEP
ncbi:MAG: hypothetical protein AB7F88_17400 [Pyrinomonadaceae bacterium]